MKYLICMLVDDAVLKEPYEPEMTPDEIIAEFMDDFDEVEKAAVTIVVFAGAQAEELTAKLAAQFHTSQHGDPISLRRANDLH